MNPQKLISVLNIVCLCANLIVGIIGIFVLRDAKKTNKEFREKYKL